MRHECDYPGCGQPAVDYEPRFGYHYCDKHRDSPPVEFNKPGDAKPPPKER